MKSLIFFLGFIFFSSGVFSQEKYNNHTVLKGETIYQIAKKYGVKPKELIDLNPESNSVLKLNSVLLIPNNSLKNTLEKKEVIVKNTIHEVQVKETLYGISKQYQTTVDAILKANPMLVVGGLKVGQKIEVPNSNLKGELIAEQKSVVKKEILKSDVIKVEELSIQQPILKQDIIKENPIDDSKEEKTFLREILPKETKYGIAKEYGISVVALEDQNPEIKNKFPIGYKLRITTNKKMAISQWDIPLANDSSIKEEPLVTAKDTTSLRENNHSDLLNRLVVVASDNIGVRYRMGGMSKEGYDCSGLMVTTFESCDIKLPRTSNEQSQFGKKIALSEAQKGDLIFFKIRNKKRINHVGMVVEVTEDEVKFIHASVRGGVMISSTKEPYYQKYFAQVNHVLEN